MKQEEIEDVALVGGIPSPLHGLERKEDRYLFRTILNVDTANSDNIASEISPVGEEGLKDGPVMAACSYPCSECSALRSRTPWPP